MRINIGQQLACKPVFHGAFLSQKSSVETRFYAAGMPRPFYIAPSSVYHSPVTETKVAGFSSPIGAAMSRSAFAVRLFCRLGASSFGRPGRGSRKARRCSTGLLTPFGAALPFSSGLAVQNRNWSKTMALIAQDAAASIHPNALTSRESSVVRKALEIIESKRLKNADILYYMEDFERYLVMRFAGLSHEQGHVVYLDINRRLIDADTLAFGNQSQVSWDIRHVAFRAMALGAEHVVMAHNHPSDNPTPSDADVQNLNVFEKGLCMVGINLLDSFVVTSKKITSIKNYRNLCEEAKSRERQQQYDRREAERKAKREANKAAKRMAQQQGANHV